MSGTPATITRTERTFEVGPGAGAVSALAIAPPGAEIALAFAHGAGAGMRHPFMEAIAVRLAARRVATLRYQFPYMEKGLSRTDSPSVATATVRAAVAAMREQWPDAALFAGGKSFGSRMTSTAMSLGLLPDVRGLVFFGFPLHPAGRPGRERADHLDRVEAPMLFLQGTRDALCDIELLGVVLERLDRRARLRLWDGADHSFHVLKRSGRTDEQVLDELAESAAQWMAEIAGATG
jgi:predicted alpha/beta-hydrolase family hydrolase